MTKRMFAFWLFLMVWDIGWGLLDRTLAFFYCHTKHCCLFFPQWFSLSTLAIYVLGSFLVARSITRSLWKRILLLMWMLVYGTVVVNVTRYILELVVKLVLS
jgi:hypothetical protein